MITSDSEIYSKDCDELDENFFYISQSLLKGEVSKSFITFN